MLRTLCFMIVSFAAFISTASAQDLVWTFLDSQADSYSRVGNYNPPNVSDDDEDGPNPLSASTYAILDGGIYLASGCELELDGDGTTTFSAWGVHEADCMNDPLVQGEYMLAGNNSHFDVTMRLDSLSSQTGTRTVYGSCDFSWASTGNLADFINLSDLVVDLYVNDAYRGQVKIFGAAWYPNEDQVEWTNGLDVTYDDDGTDSSYDGSFNIALDLEIGDELRIVGWADNGDMEFVSDTPVLTGTSDLSWTFDVSTVAP